MKKSKVIIPAMALLLFSTAASITGTVAWFTSSRVYTMQAGDFKIANIDGNLECDVTAGIGTFVNSAGNIVVGQDSDNDKTADTNTANLLLDGSFDITATAADQKAYRLDRDATLSNRFYEARGLRTDAEAGHWLYRSMSVGTSPAVATKYYVAVSWTLTFKYTFNSETEDIGIYLDLKGSSFARQVGSETVATEGAYTGFDSAVGMRIAFIGNLTANKVFGNRSLGGTDHEYDDLKYVSGTSATTPYSAANYNVHDGDYERIGDAANTTQTATYLARPERICTIAHGTGQQSQAVDCVAWFEGEDPYVVNNTAMAVVGATLQFYSRADSSVAP